MLTVSPFSTTDSPTRKAATGGTSVMVISTEEEAFSPLGEVTVRVTVWVPFCW